MAGRVAVAGAVVGLVGSWLAAPPAAAATRHSCPRRPPRRGRRHPRRDRVDLGLAPSAFTLCGSTVGGSVGVVSAPGPVTIAAVGNWGTDTVAGSIAALIASGGVKVSGIQVGQSVLGWDATGPPPTIAGNSIGGTLWCANDLPPPSDGGRPNAVTGRLGQCAAAGS